MTVSPDSTAGTNYGLGWHTVCCSSCIMVYQKGYWWAGHWKASHPREENYRSLSWSPGVDLWVVLLLAGVMRRMVSQVQLKEYIESSKKKKKKKSRE